MRTFRVIRAVAFVLLLGGCSLGFDPSVRVGALVGDTNQGGNFATASAGASAYVTYRRAAAGVSFDYAESPQTMNAWYIDALYRHRNLSVGVGQSSICFSSADCDTPVSPVATYTRGHVVWSARYLSFDTSNRKDPLRGRAVLVGVGWRP